MRKIAVILAVLAVAFVFASGGCKARKHPYVSKDIVLGDKGLITIKGKGFSFSPPIGWSLVKKRKKKVLKYHFTRGYDRMMTFMINPVKAVPKSFKDKHGGVDIEKARTRIINGWLKNYAKKHLAGSYSVKSDDDILTVKIATKEIRVAQKVIRTKTGERHILAAAVFVHKGTFFLVRFGARKNAEMDPVALLQAGLKLT
jgi:hypothetical protein